MPWVRLDDRFPSNRKISLLSDRAFRLYVSALCWCSENLTEGSIREQELHIISRVRGAKAVAAELEKAGLWDRTVDGWVVHDYLDYNPSRAKVREERAANAARQQAYRDRKRAERKAASNTTRNAVTADGAEAPESTTATRTRRDSDTNALANRSEEDDPSQVTAIRNAVSNGAPSRPVPITTTTSSFEEAKQDTDIPIRADVERVCRHLADRIEDNGSKRPTITKAWRDSARLMLDRDGRSVDQIMRAIDWCQNDDFWRANVLSMTKLRKQYEQLRLKAAAEQRKTKPTQSRDQSYADRGVY